MYNMHSFIHMYNIHSFIKVQSLSDLTIMIGACKNVDKEISMRNLYYMGLHSPSVAIHYTCYI